MKQEDIENRFTYHPPKERQPEMYVHIREMAKTYAHELNELCPEGREKELAMTHLEEVVFWANASIARGGQ